MRRRQLFIICLILAGSISLLANTVQIGELYYNLNYATKTAEVTYKSCEGETYNTYWNISHANIPSSVSYSNENYIVRSIGEHAFCECKSLISVEIPSSVKTIGNLAFYGCSKLYEINVPYSVNYIGTGAFYECQNLTYVTLPSSAKSIGKHAFSGCSKLSSVTIPDGIKGVEDCTFRGCSQLKSVVIPNSVQYIDNYAFSGCSSLTKIVLPNSVKKIGNYAFSGCTSLKELYCSKEVNYTSANIPSPTRVIVNTENTTPAKQYSSNTNQSLPPVLELEEKSLSFSDASNNNRIDAEEQCNIKFRIKNSGKGIARNCEVRVRMSGSSKGITCNIVRLPAINPEQKYNVTVPVSSDINTHNGNVTFTIEVYEPNGWGVAPFDLTVATKAYEPPYLQVVDYNITSNSGKIRKMEPFTLLFNLQNTKYGEAKDVKVKIRIPDNIFIMDGSAEATYSSIKSGEVKPIRVTLIANNNYAIERIPITIEIKEKHGRFAESKDISLALNQSANSSILITAIDEPADDRKEIQLALIKSDVDRNIPTTKTKNANTFVLIVANEHYLQEASVPFALNDGNIFKEYCVKTLGIGEKHIKLLTDATGNQIKAGVNWLANLTEAFDNPQIIVYYAGHGIPDEASKSAYLLPVDGSGTDVTTGYKLDELYATLGNMPASRITVFMDACFSGSKREDGMLASARGVALKAKSGVPQGNMVVFSAAQGDETAYPNREQQHGLFTYYLLKKLQETEGNVGLKDLGDYVTKQVSQQSLLLNSKKQTPCVTPSAEVGTDWENWKLK